MTALTITGLVVALLVTPGWAAFELVRRRKGLVRWSGLTALSILPVTLYLWQYSQATAHRPVPDAFGFVDVLFKAAVLVWWLSAAIGAAGAVMSREMDRADKEPQIR